MGSVYRLWIDRGLVLLVKEGVFACSGVCASGWQNVELDTDSANLQGLATARLAVSSPNETCSNACKVDKLV
jgi:hypothetical protein